MASLPKPNPEWEPMTLDELEAIYGTPEFDREYARQMKAVAEHDRANRYADWMEPDWAWLDKVWK